MTEKTINEITHAEPISIEIQRAKDGTYYWTIKSHAKDLQQALKDVWDMDKNLRVNFLPVPTESSGIKLTKPAPEKGA